MSQTRSRCLAAALALLLGAPARADLRDAVNGTRMQDCSSRAVRAPLRDSVKLRGAALRLENGASLRAALAAEGYRASQSSAVHLWGTRSDADVQNLLTQSRCETVADAKFSELGVERRGEDVWLILAAPLPLPDPEDADALNRRILELVNASRARARHCGSKYFASARPLTGSPALNAAALAHSREMAKHGDFDHRESDGSTPSERIERAGYGPYRVVGENIAAGAMSPAEVMQGWLHSPDHCENIMDPRFSQIGIAFALNPSTSLAIYWTQDFAAPAGPARSK